MFHLPVYRSTGSIIHTTPRNTPSTQQHTGLSKGRESTRSDKAVHVYSKFHLVKDSPATPTNKRRRGGEWVHGDVRCSSEVGGDADYSRVLSARCAANERSQPLQPVTTLLA